MNLTPYPHIERRVMDYFIANPNYKATKRPLSIQIRTTQRAMQTVLRCLNEAGKLKIADWAYSGTQPLPRYQLADGTPDAPRPVAKTHTERTREYRARNPVAVELEILQKRIDRLTEKRDALRRQLKPVKTPVVATPQVKMNPIDQLFWNMSSAPR